MNGRKIHISEWFFPVGGRKWVLSGRETGSFIGRMGGQKVSKDTQENRVQEVSYCMQRSIYSSPYIDHV